MSALASQIQARKERLQRFAEAAARYENRKISDLVAAKIIVPQPLVEPAPERRRYESHSLAPNHTPITWRIFRAVSEEFGMPASEIISPNRDANYILPRYVIIGLMFELTDISIPGIGRRLGGRDHTTIINGRKRIKALLESEAFRNRFDQIKANISNG